MKHQVDKIFSNKLQNHTIQPSEAVWDKVSAGVAKKRKAWYLPTGIAAGLALLLSITLLLNRNGVKRIETTAPTNRPIVDSESSMPQTIIPETNSPELVEVKEVVEKETNRIEQKGNTISIATIAPKEIKQYTEATLKTVDISVMPKKEKVQEVIYISFTSNKEPVPKPSLKAKATDYVSEQYKKVKEGEEVELPKIPLPRIEIKIDRVFAFNKTTE